MHCLPRKSVLVRMSNENRHTILGLFATEIRVEIEGLQSGYIMPWNGATRSGLLQSARRRLQRVYSAADHFGDYVGQPD